MTDTQENGPEQSMPSRIQIDPFIFWQPPNLGSEDQLNQNLGGFLHLKCDNAGEVQDLKDGFLPLRSSFLVKWPTLMAVQFLSSNLLNPPALSKR